MATFYVLPPRSQLEESLTGLLGKLLPGLPLPVDAWDAVTDRLAEIAAWPHDVFLVPRDDLAPGETAAESLTMHFGAEPGDRVIEVNANGSRTWTVEAGMSALAFAR